METITQIRAVLNLASGFIRAVGACRYDCSQMGKESTLETNVQDRSGDAQVARTTELCRGVGAQQYIAQIC